jgi:hypothetical protein
MKEEWEGEEEDMDKFQLKINFVSIRHRTVDVN